MIGSFILVGIAGLVLWLEFSSRTERLNARIARLDSDLSKI